MAEETNKGREKSYDSFDIFKIICSIVIVMIHLKPFGNSHFHWLHPWCRIAIPVFFMISSFLFFSKYDNLPKEEKNGYLWKFIKRDLILYLFWFVVFLPFTIIYRDYLHKGIVFFLGSILMGSSFPASWYLIALAIGILFVAKLDRGVGKYIVPAVGLIFFAICLGQNTWRVIANKIVFLTKLYGASEISYAVTWFIAVIWIWIGRLFVTHKEKLMSVDIKIILGAFVGSLVLLFFEDHWLYIHGLFTGNNDTYLCCLLACPLLFWIVLKLNVHLTNAKTLRCMSTLIYCIHATIGEFLKVYVVTPRFGYEMPWSILCFLLTMAITLLLSHLILKYSEKFRILKYAY